MNHCKFLVICVQWVDEEYLLRKALLGLPQLRYSHGGELQAWHILEAIRFFRIHEKIGYFVCDNATVVVWIPPLA
jgi:hypothetical protein